MEETVLYKAVCFKLPYPDSANHNSKVLQKSGMAQTDLYFSLCESVLAQAIIIIRHQEVDFINWDDQYHGKPHLDLIRQTHQASRWGVDRGSTHGRPTTLLQAQALAANTCGPGLGSPDPFIGPSMLDLLYNLLR